MEKIFNIAGPCNPEEHFVLQAMQRCPEVEKLIKQRQYFVIHAARQSGKTTLLNTLENELNKSGELAVLYCSVETVQGIDDPREGIPAIVRAMLFQMDSHPYFRDIDKPVLDYSDYNSVLKLYLKKVCIDINKPVVILLDEVDCLSNQTLISFLRQLRDGYINRIRSPFPTSIALVGMRDIRDYKAKIRDGNQTLGSASPFNIITKSLTIGNFTSEKIAELYSQHTQETGQVFDKDAIDRVFYWTNGQPWLVNAIARECVEEILDRDYSKPITEDLVNVAVDILIKRRDTHLDSLLERLKEERVRKIIEPVILGEQLAMDYLSDDRKYCLDLGIVKDENGFIAPANRIYAEVILRTLSFGAQTEMQMMVTQTPWIKNNKLDMNGLLKSFQLFWRENSQAYTDRVIMYPEAAPHLILQAFLQRVINGGGQIIREYALGTMRLDLLVQYQEQRFPIEIKLDYQLKSEAPFKQLLEYMDRSDTKEGWLTVFSRDKEKSWGEKIGWETREIDGKTVHLVRQ
ncbi:MAG: ATP-binding protein [Chitinispirillaceae bacterium]|nr:ATP-binding protein [Chitinispirillaceae bacterium]